MADILKVTSSVVSGKAVQTGKPVQETSAAFNLQRLQGVGGPKQSGSSLVGHEIYQNETGSAVLMNLLKDPDVTVNYLKNIYMLEEIFNLLPVQNQTVTKEISQLFEALLISPEQIVEEFIRQEYASTLFKGELFSFLRELLHQNPAIKKEIAELLKAMNGTLSKQDVLDSAANNLDFLSERLAGSSTLSAKLAQLAVQIRGASTPEEFQTCKQQIMEVLKEVEQSILYNPQIEKNVSILIYNLSRYQDNPQYLNEALLNVLVYVDGRESKEELRTLVKDYLQQYDNGLKEENHSRIMNLLAEIIGKQEKETDLQSLNGDKIDKIITSLLSSPCNYTPLLHFVLPLMYEDLTAFAELWVDPNDYQETKEGVQQGVHVLATFDISGIGRLEGEFRLLGNSLSFQLFCPKEYEKVFAGLTTQFREIISQKGYAVSEIQVESMEKTRSLMDVFQSLPYKRTGVDVKI